MIQRRWLAVVGAAAVLVLAGLTGCTSSPTSHRTEATAPPTVPDPASLLRDLVRDANAEQPYRDPSDAERRAAAAAMIQLLDAPTAQAATESAFADLGLRAVSGVDPVTARPYLMFLAERHTNRSWGAILVDRSAPLNLVVEVPHTGFDIFTDVIGLETFRARPGSVLVVAGAHRNAGGGLGDVAHNEHSFFHSVVTALAERGFAQIQLHGYADESQPDSDVVVSVGSATRAVQATKLGDGLATEGFVVCRAWVRQCGQLEGTRNVQSKAAARLDTVFVHLEINWTTRNDVAARARVVRALAAAL